MLNYFTSNINHVLYAIYKYKSNGHLVVWSPGHRFDDYKF